MRRIFLLFALTLMFAFPAHAATMADVGRLSGPTREAQLVAGAKKEGTLTFYSAMPVEINNAVIAAFQKKYGVKVQLWRGSAGDILQRLLTESRAGHDVVDTGELAGVEMEAASRAGLLEDVQSPVFAELMKGVVVPGRPYVSARVSIFVGAYNTNMVKKADAPKTFQDLTLPKWKGKLAVEADDSNWLMGIAQVMGNEKAIALFRSIVAANGVSPRRGHTLISNLVASGEVPLAVETYKEGIDLLKHQGAPVEELDFPPVLAMINGAAVFKHAPHPYAGMLFLDFLLSAEGQTILKGNDVTPTNVKVQQLPKGLNLTFMDIPRYIDESAKWTKIYKDILAQQPR